MTPLNLTEWAQGKALGQGFDDETDFAREVLDLIENNRADDWAELVEELEFASGHRKRGSNVVVPGFTHDQALKALEDLCDKVNTLDEIAEKLAAAGFPGDPKGKKGFPSGPSEVVEEVLSKLGRASDIVDWVRSFPDDYAEAVADLIKLFPLPEPKKPEPPKLEFDL